MRELERNYLLWICPKCGWRTPRTEGTTPEEVGDCVRCSGQPFHRPTVGEHPLKAGRLAFNEEGTMMVPTIDP